MVAYYLHPNDSNYIYINPMPFLKSLVCSTNCSGQCKMSCVLLCMWSQQLRHMSNVKEVASASGAIGTKTTENRETHGLSQSPTRHEEKEREDGARNRQLDA